MHKPDIGSVVTSIKGPNMVYHSKKNISRKKNLNVYAPCVKFWKIQEINTKC